MLYRQSAAPLPSVILKYFVIAAVLCIPMPSMAEELKIIEPALGQKYKAGDTVNIVYRTDIDVVYIYFSLDNGLTWVNAKLENTGTPLTIEKQKDGVEVDTFPWTPEMRGNDESRVLNKNLKIVVYDYSETYVEYAHFSFESTAGIAGWPRGPETQGCREGRPAVNGKYLLTAGNTCRAALMYSASGRMMHSRDISGEETVSLPYHSSGIGVLVLKRNDRSQKTNRIVFRTMK